MSKKKRQQRTPRQEHYKFFSYGLGSILTKGEQKKILKNDKVVKLYKQRTLSKIESIKRTTITS